ncbi:23S rRNA (cytidine-2'-O)-methyltransferase TlyA [Halarcobacter bivalviorum]|uniref:23S rRNA (cytidine-2'-O)-methyltransferase TlyA n=1 Tax=Halarcobacter bivalviorum TaxID=663364 RepID=UPI00100C1AC0|nr:TlyA family RNA methyltransferase [Halarcobacter bivalviorum]RXK07130.1 TlyA family rRNA (cytidine-2'-O)-methyltransferase [Halarcobacter bivalviorum]
MRLDLYLTKHFDIQSRNKASELIKSKKVKVDEKIISKPSFIVDENSKIELLEEDFYVSRAAYKLKYFLEEFNIDIKNKTALDIGSSTGGFTQILLEKEVKSVICVDVGSNQLHERIRDDKRITFFENQDIRTFESDDYFEVVSCDVSFISILNIIEDIHRLSKDKIIILFKPQFEVGNNVKRDKKGVVKDNKAILKAREKFLEKCKQLDWNLIACAKSKLEGKDGNEEELFYFNK